MVMVLSQSGGRKQASTHGDGFQSTNTSGIKSVINQDKSIEDDRGHLGLFRCFSNIRTAQSHQLGGVSKKHISWLVTTILAARSHLCCVSGNNQLHSPLVYSSDTGTLSIQSISWRWNPHTWESQQSAHGARKSCAEVGGNCQGKRVTRSALDAFLLVSGVRCKICEKTTKQHQARYPGQVCNDQSYRQGSFTIAKDDIPTCVFLFAIPSSCMQLIKPPQSPQPAEFISFYGSGHTNSQFMVCSSTHRTWQQI